MANEKKTSMVNLETSFEDNDLTIDELAQFFEELQNRYEISLAQNKKLKKKNDFLKNKVEIVFKENNDLPISFEKMKRIMINTNLFVRVKALILLLTKMNFWISKNVLMFWIPL